MDYSIPINGIRGTPSLATLPQGDRSTVAEKRNEAEQSRTAARIGAGVGVATAFALGAAFKNGLNAGFQRIGHFTNAISNLISAPFSLAFLPFILNNERVALRDEEKGKDDLFNRMVYTAASLGFTPNTWGEPLMMGTRSKPHMIATVLNLPHMLFSLLSYTGGRLMSCIKAFQMKFERDPVRKFRLEQEFDAFFTLGNLGSAQASVIPMSGQCILGWETLKDVFTGNFGSALERFKHEPISVLLGTFFNSWMWPFEYLAKFFDTTIRTAESVDNFKNAFSQNNWMIKKLEELRDKWHVKARDSNSLLGKCLKWAREGSKIEALLIPPIGMASVVTPAFNKFLRGEFWNKEAQEIGGPIGFFDKIFNIGAFFSHIFYTSLYALNVRVPQTITTATFYISRLINKVRGLGDKPNDPHYLEPNKIREKIFSWAPIKRLSDWAAKRLDKTESELHKEGDRELIGESGRCRYIRTFRQVIAKEVAYDSAHEELYKHIINQRLYDENLGYTENGQKKKGRYKEIGEKPSDKLWGNLLKERKEDLLKTAKEKLKTYLEESQLLAREQITEFMEREYDSSCTRYENKKHELKIDKILEKLVDDELERCKSENQKESTQESKVQSKSFLELLKTPSDWLEILKLRTFHVTNSILPLWVRGFVDVVDFGENGEPDWLRNLKATESGIREGDVQQACNREFMPVVAFAFQSMGKGLAIVWNLLHGRLPQFAE